MGTTHNRPPGVAPRDPVPLLADLRTGARPLNEEIELLLQRLEDWEPMVESLLPDESHSQRRERLLREARELEARWPDPAGRPPLYGVVVGVKDLFHAAGFPTRAGSRLPAEVFLPEDHRTDTSPDAVLQHSAESVRLLQEAGALLLGKTVTTEFAYFGPGPTRNPWNREHTPGGSSSGSAAAVAAGFCHVALGTQTIGSISRPASFCGLAGFKPSFDRISVSGVVPFSPNADHIGVIAPSARALSTVAPILVRDWNADAVVNGAATARDTLRTPLGTVLIPDDAYSRQSDDDARRALDSVCERLQGIGVAVQRINLFPDIDAINSMHQDMIAFDFSRVHAQWYEAYGDHYQERSRQLVETGRTIDPDRHASALEGRIELRKRIQAALERHDATVIIAPATVGEAPRGIDATGSPIMNLPWTFAGVPTVSLPLTTLPRGRGSNGLPLGIQLVTSFGRDEQVLDFAVMVEEALR